MSADEAFGRALDLDERAAHSRDQATALTFATRSLVHATLAGIEQQRERWSEVDKRRDEQAVDELDPPPAFMHPGLHPGEAEHSGAAVVGGELTDHTVCDARVLVVDALGDAWRARGDVWVCESRSRTHRLVHDLRAEFGPCRVVWVP